MTQVRPVDQPLAWVGHDRLLCNDKTVYGLRRKVIARKDEPPNCVTWIAAVMDEAAPAVPKWWFVLRNDYFFLWIVWKVDDEKIDSAK